MLIVGSSCVRSAPSELVKETYMEVLFGLAILMLANKEEQLAVAH